MYRFENSTITESKTFAFKIITIAPPSTIVSSTSVSHVSLKGKDANKVKTEIIALEKLRGYGAVVELYEAMTDEGIAEVFGSFGKRVGRKGKPVCLVMEYCP
jgi:hypothetical protein